MRTVGTLLVALSALALLSAAGCSSDGYTPKCTPPDFADCLEPAKGGNYYVDSATPDNAVQPEAAADQNVQPEAASDAGADVEPADTAAPDAAPDAADDQAAD